MDNRYYIRGIRTPLGVMLALASDAGLVLLDFTDRDGFTDQVQKMGRDQALQSAEHPALRLLEAELASYFSGNLAAFSIPLAPLGTPFQEEVWKSLKAIPFGETRTYGEVAVLIGKPGAARSVGRANGQNFRAIVVPCHRLVGADGSLTGYGGGVWRKQWLLAHEKKVVTARAGGG